MTAAVLETAKIATQAIVATLTDKSKQAKGKGRETLAGALSLFQDKVKADPSLAKEIPEEQAQEMLTESGLGGNISSKILELTKQNETTKLAFKAQREPQEKQKEISQDTNQAKEEQAQSLVDISKALGPEHASLRNMLSDGILSLAANDHALETYQELLDFSNAKIKMISGEPQQISQEKMLEQIKPLTELMKADQPQAEKLTAIFNNLDPSSQKLVNEHLSLTNVMKSQGETGLIPALEALRGSPYFKVLKESLEQHALSAPDSETQSLEESATQYQSIAEHIKVLSYAARRLDPATGEALSSEQAQELKAKEQSGEIPKITPELFAKGLADILKDCPKKQIKLLAQSSKTVEDKKSMDIISSMFRLAKRMKGIAKYGLLIPALATTSKQFFGVLTGKQSIKNGALTTYRTLSSNPILLYWFASLTGQK